MREEYMTNKEDYFCYYICSTDEQDRKFITTQNNQNVKINIEKILVDWLDLQDNNKWPKGSSKIIVVTDYVAKKIIVVYSS